MAVFVVDRLVVFIAAGNIVADPDFRRAAFFLDQPDGFRHHQVQREAGEGGCRGSEFFRDLRDFQDRIGVRHMVVDSDVGEIVDVLFAGMPPNEIIRDLLRTVPVPAEDPRADELPEG